MELKEALSKIGNVAVGSSASLNQLIKILGDQTGCDTIKMMEWVSMRNVTVHSANLKIQGICQGDKDMIIPLSVKNQSIDSSGITNDYKEAICEYVWNGLEVRREEIPKPGIFGIHRGLICNGIRQFKSCADNHQPSMIIDRW